MENGYQRYPLRLVKGVPVILKFENPVNTSNTSCVFEQSGIINHKRLFVKAIGNGQRTIPVIIDSLVKKVYLGDSELLGDEGAIEFTELEFTTGEDLMLLAVTIEIEKDASFL